jgi:c-Rel proto-oncogene protein
LLKNQLSAGNGLNNEPNFLINVLLPYLRILSQPYSLRFRYLSEGRGQQARRPGLPLIVYSQPQLSFELRNLVGNVAIIISCVTAVTDSRGRYLVHPHKITGREGCGNGVCTIYVESNGETSVEFRLGIECVRRDCINASFKERKRVGVDPFNGEN